MVFGRKNKLPKAGDKPKDDFPPIEEKPVEEEVKPETTLSNQELAEELGDAIEMHLMRATQQLKTYRQLAGA